MRLMQTRKLLLVLFVFIQLSTFGQQESRALDPAIEDQITKILATLSLEEKVGQTCQITLDALFERDADGAVIEPGHIDPKKLKEAIVDYGIGSILNVGWHTFDRATWDVVMEEVHAPYDKGESKAPILYGIDAIHGVNYTKGGTLFPQEIGLAATWNPCLAKKFGEVTAYETRASGIHWNFSPVLDLGRQPLWSRTFETLGEDVYLASALGRAIIDGYQGQGGIDSEHVVSCMKHFVGYSNPQSGRDRTPAWIPNKYMHELYLPPFKAAVNQGALTVMINSGVVNGIPGHTNYDLITKTLKEDWGFQGFAVSDWEDYIMLNTVHRTAEDISQAIVSGFNAGVDMSMVPYAPQYKEYCELMIQAVKDGKIAPDRLDDAVRRILRVKITAGLYEKRMNQQKKYPDFGSEKFQQLALESALESITLLKNDSETLPLSSEQKILIAGPTSNNLVYLNGAWTHTWQGADTSFNTKGCKSIREAFAEKLGTENCLFSQGAELYIENGFEATRLVNTEDFKAKAAQSDVIVLCLGEYPATEKPGDIRSLNLPEEQLELAKMAYATGKPVVLVLVEGRPRILRSIVDDASSIVQAYLPGDYGGEALVQLMFGEENFSGRLPYTYPKYDGVIEFYDRPRSVDRAKDNEFKSFDPQWEFGFGMSYSTITYTNLQIDRTEMSRTDSIKVTVDVTNSSSIAAKEVVQLYVADLYASLVPAGKTLKAFEKITLDPGKTKTVEFYVSNDALQFVDSAGDWVSEPGNFEITIGDLTRIFSLK